ncbi:carbohydrate kinase family protein [Streptomyces sp. NPDC060085]|uniref:carbohydrate kinase family protein n=1 Tax=Streptomyces sp. NPDC060085 TaxID=3347054 RepID=UPI003649EE87
MGEQSHVRITVLGDVNLEVTGFINPRFDEISSSRLLSAPLKVHVGGTAANFAIAARAHFQSVRLIGAVGIDEQGSWAEKVLNSQGIETRLYRCPVAPTGTVVALRDGGSPHGNRLMIVSPDSANTALTAEYITSNSDVLTAAEFMVADGYALLSEPRRSAVLEAMQRAARCGARVVLDLVPHHLDALIDSAELRVWLAHASIVVCEVETARRILGLPLSNRPIQLQEARETAEHLAIEFPRRSFLLRFGIANIDQSLIWEPHGETTHYFTGFSQMEETYAFGDRLTAKELARHFAGSRALKKGEKSSASSTALH